MKSFCWIIFFCFINVLASTEEISQPSGFPILTKEGFIPIARNKVTSWLEDFYEKLGMVQKERHLDNKLGI